LPGHRRAWCNDPDLGLDAKGLQVLIDAFYVFAYQSFNFVEDCVVDFFGPFAFKRTDYDLRGRFIDYVVNLTVEVAAYE
jgi:hypothetical protein